MISLLVLSLPAAAATTPRMGAWVDEIVLVEEADSTKGVARIESGEFDVYAYSISNADLARKIRTSPLLDYSVSYGSYNEMSFNPSGPVFSGTGKLNPFAVPAIREAMNILIDRDYICNEISAGMMVPRFFAMNTTFPDSARYADTVRKLEIQYAHNPEKAKQIVTAEMEKLGAKLVNGKWTYNGEPVVIIGIIRVEDERLGIGDYFSNLLESIGFTVDRQYKTSSEASPIWMQSNPADGKWHFYTGGWVTTAIDRDLANNFNYFHTPVGMPVPLWQAYNPDPRFAEVADRLERNDFKTLEERAALFKEALELQMKDSVRVWLTDRIAVWPRAKDIKIASDMASGYSGTRLWSLTLRREGQVGGKVTIGQPSMLTEPWNPIAGTNWIYDMMPIRALAAAGVVADPYTGLNHAWRIERAEITVQEGLPVGKTLDWVDLKFAKEIVVPGDAWVDWDAKAQRFITAAEKYPQGLKAVTKMVVYYPKDFLKTVKWHDGSSFSLADMVLSLILSFDRGNPDSPIYDEAAVPALKTFVAHFKGCRIVSKDPVIIEYYDDAWYQDAEYIGATLYPNYAQGEGAWHNLAVGIKADAAGELAFSQGKADKLKVEWMSFIAGPSLSILSKYLDQSASELYIPYAPTLSQFITPEEAKARYANLKSWYQSKKHFWVGTGPFYLESVHPVEKIVVLKRFEQYPDPADRWASFGEPRMAVADVAAPSVLRRNRPAQFTISVKEETNGNPYPVNDIDFVKYMVFDSKDNMVASGEAKAVKDGVWEVALTAEDTAKIPMGSGRLEIVAVPIPVCIPAKDSVQFVMLP